MGDKGLVLHFGYHSSDLEFVYEIAKLTKTTPLRYKDVYWVCEAYGEGYKELIQKHIDAGTTHQALDEMNAELLLRRLRKVGDK